jgi:hypothetical protein
MFGRYQEATFLLASNLSGVDIHSSPRFIHPRQFQHEERAMKNHNV